MPNFWLSENYFMVWELKQPKRMLKFYRRVNYAENIFRGRVLEFLFLVFGQLNSSLIFSSARNQHGRSRDPLRPVVQQLERGGVRADPQRDLRHGVYPHDRHSGMKDSVAKNNRLQYVLLNVNRHWASLCPDPSFVLNFLSWEIFCLMCKTPVQMTFYH